MILFIMKKKTYFSCKVFIAFFIYSNLEILPDIHIYTKTKKKLSYWMPLGKENLH